MRFDGFCCVVLCLVWVSLLPGCSGSSDEKEDAVEQSNETPSTEVTNRLTMTVQTYDKTKGNYDTANIIQSPSEEDVRKQFQALNWSDPNLVPSIKFVRMEDGKLSGLFVVSRNQESEEGEIVAEWVNPDKGEFTSPKIDSPDSALKLLLMFHGKRPELEKAVEWKSLN
jgi:hypothetical protein